MKWLGYGRGGRIENDSPLTKSEWYREGWHDHALPLAAQSLTTILDSTKLNNLFANLSDLGKSAALQYRTLRSSHHRILQPSLNVSLLDVVLSFSGYPRFARLSLSLAIAQVLDPGSFRERASIASSRDKPSRIWLAANPLADSVRPRKSLSRALDSTHGVWLMVASFAVRRTFLCIIRLSQM